MNELLFSLIVTLLLTFALVHVGLGLKVYGQKSYRRIKEETVPQLGGVGIAGGLFLTAWYNNQSSLLDFLIVASPIILGGIIDDFRELNARSKLLFQFLAAGLLINLRYESLLWVKWDQHVLITSVLTIFFVVAICNAINFIDGLDGLVSSYFLSVVPIIFLIPNSLTDSATYLLGSVLAFTYFNKKPAKIYLGDVGSNLIGLILAYSFLTYTPNNEGKHFIILGFLMVLSLPLLDMTLATIRRLLAGSSPFSGDKDHIHHRLLKLGLNDTQVSIVFFFVGALCSNVGWLLINEASALQKWSILFSAMGVLSIMLYLVFRTEGHLGKHISHFGRTLIETYIPLTDVNTNLPESELNRALIIDLFNYYKELQRLGIPRVVSFVKDVSGLITFRFKGARVMLLSSYSLAIICPKDKKWGGNELEGIKNDFHRLTEKHKATRLMNGDPEGLYFYDKEEFLVFYREMEKKNSVIKSKAA